MTVITRFNATRRGALTFTGNTLGLSGPSLGEIRAFITLNTSLQVPGGFPPGTTLDFPMNSSGAILDLPAGSTILYAELVWGGSTVFPGGNILDRINDPIVFTLPDGEATTIVPDPATAQTTPAVGAGQIFYVRSANVTELVARAGAGFYSAGAVPGTVNGGISLNQTDCCGWTLEVAYANQEMPFRNMTLYVAGELITVELPPVEVDISGFSTPLEGALSGRALLSAEEGDTDIVGDGFFFGMNAGALIQISGPNNPPNNFFASQINNDAGLLDTSGTFGDRNQTLGAFTPFAREGWDITNVDVSNTFFNGQTSAVARFTTNGDAYVLSAFGLQIDIAQPVLELVKSADRTATAVGDVITYTVVVVNSGTVSASDLVIADAIPAGTAFVPDSVTVEGTPIPGADPASGVLVGTIPADSSVTLTFQVLVTEFNDPPEVVNTASSTFTFPTVPGGPVISGDTNEDTVVIPQFGSVLTVTKTSNFTGALVGETILYTVQAANSGNAPATNVVISDPLPAGTEFVAGSVTVGGVPQPGANPAAVTVGAIQPGEAVTISYRLRIVAAVQPPVVVNQAVVHSEVDPPGVVNPPIVQPPVVSPPSITVIVEPRLELDKRANVGETSSNEIIQYTIVAVNTGNVNLTNVVLADRAPQGTAFVPGTVTLDGISQPASATELYLVVATLAPGQRATASFQVRTAVEAGRIVNQSQATAIPVFPGRTLPPMTFESNAVEIPVVEEEE